MICPTYDVLNHLTNMVDAVGTTAYGYDNVGELSSEAGPWSSDTVSYTYANRVRTGLSLSQPSGSWSQSYGYDVTRPVANVTSQPAVSVMFMPQDGHGRTRHANHGTRDAKGN